MQEQKSERLLLRPAEAFESIGVSRSVGYALIARGELPAIKIGRSIRVPVHELQTFVNQRIAEVKSNTSIFEASVPSCDEKGTRPAPSPST